MGFYDNDKSTGARGNFKFDLNYLNSVNSNVIVKAGNAIDVLEKEFYYSNVDNDEYTWDISLIGDEKEMDEWDNEFYITADTTYGKTFTDPNELIASSFEPAMDLYYQAIDKYPNELDGVFVALYVENGTYKGERSWEYSGCFVLYPTGDGRFILDNKWPRGYK